MGRSSWGAFFALDLLIEDVFLQALIGESVPGRKGPGLKSPEKDNWSGRIGFLPADLQ